MFKSCSFKMSAFFLSSSFFFFSFPYFSTAVQEERQRVKEKGEGEVESTSSANVDMPVERILEAELAVEPKIETYIDTQVSWYDPLLNKSYCSLTYSPTLTLCLSLSLCVLAIVWLFINLTLHTLI